MSSKEAIPEDVKIVDDENDEARVPAKRSAVLELVFLLNVDILAQHHRFKCGRQRRRDDKLLARAVRQQVILSMTSNIFRRIRPSIIGTLYVRLLSL